MISFYLADLYDDISARAQFYDGQRALDFATAVCYPTDLPYAVLTCLANQRRRRLQEKSCRFCFARTVCLRFPTSTGTGQSQVSHSRYSREGRPRQSASFVPAESCGCNRTRFGLESKINTNTGKPLCLSVLKMRLLAGRYQLFAISRSPRK